METPRDLIMQCNILATYSYVKLHFKHAVHTFHLSTAITCDIPSTELQMVTSDSRCSHIPYRTFMEHWTAKFCHTASHTVQ